MTLRQVEDVRRYLTQNSEPEMEQVIRELQELYEKLVMEKYSKNEADARG